MNRQSMYRSKWTNLIALLVILVLVGCTGQLPPPTSPPTLPSATAESSSPTDVAAASPTEPGVEATATPPPSTDQNVLYQEDFTNKGTGWPEADFGDYFIGYHEPEYYHIEIKTANAKAPVVSIPDPDNNHSFPDATIEMQVFAVSGKTASDGDYRYGVAFRRSGDNYYAFTISPTSKKWEVLKSSPSGISVLTEGVDENIQGIDVDDLLRVDEQGSTFSFSINDGFVGQVTDSDYADGEIGLYAENLTNTNTHVHFNTLTILNLQAPPPEDEGALLYEEDFTNKGTGWPEADFGDYFIGYHEPEYYHIEIKTANAKAPVVSIPDPDNNRSFPDATIELQALTVSGKTASDGDYRYGVVFRRSGDNYYAFTISPTSKKWEVFKSSPSGLTTLKEGVDENIQGIDVDDLLRVDAQGPNFLFTINDQLVSQVTDSDYADGEIGLYAENLTNTNTHVHFNTLSIRGVKFALICKINEGGTVYVRSGPSQTFPNVGLLTSGDTVKALGKSSTGWIEVQVEGSNEPGWVSYGEGYMTCSPSVDLFPIVNP